MIVVCLLLILVAVTLLVLGLAAGSSPLLISSIAASLLAAVALVIGARQAATQRRRDVRAEPLTATRRAAGASAGRGPRSDPDLGSAASVVEAPPVRGDAPSDFSGSDPIFAEGRPPIPAETRQSSEAVSGSEEGRRSPDEEPGLADDGQIPHATDPSDPLPTSAAVVTAPPGADGRAADDDGDFDEDDEDDYDDAEPPPLSGTDARAAGGYDADAALAGEPTGPPDVSGGMPATRGADEDDPADEPPPQRVRPADAVRVARMDAEVLVVDGRPRYHLGDCPHLVGRNTEPLPVNEAVELGFSPCGRCHPVDRLVDQATHR